MMKISLRKPVKPLIATIVISLLVTGCSNSGNTAHSDASTSDSSTGSGENTLGNDDTQTATSGPETETDIETPTAINTADESDALVPADNTDGSGNDFHSEELTSETNPMEVEAVDDTTRAINLIDIPQDLIRTAAGYSIDQLAVITADLAYLIGQTTVVIWPDDNWYEVQDPESKASLCNGGAECRLLPGSYETINHTSNTRSLLELPYIQSADLAHATQLSDSSISIDNEFLEGAATVNLERWQYNCEGGGTLIVESGEGRDSLTGFATGLAERQSYSFNQCQVTLSNWLIPDGNYVVQGAFQVDLIWAAGGWTQQSFFSFDEFSLVGDEGLEYRAQADIENLRVNSAVFIDRRNAQISNYQKILPDSQAVEAITSGHLRFESQREDIGRFRSLALEVSGTVSNSQTAHQPVIITTVQAMYFQLSDTGFEDNYPTIPYNGSLNISAEDGSFLSVNANPFVDPELGNRRYIPQLDLKYSSATGEQSTVSGQEQVIFPGSPDRGFCWFNKDETTLRLECPNREDFFVP